MNSTLVRRGVSSARFTTENQRRQQHLVGFDLFRGIAAFAVIFLHAGLVENSALTTNVIRVRGVFDFAVPFFLLASFYFAVRGLKPDFRRGPSIWKSARRLLVPYLVWTLIYLGLRVVKLLILPQSTRMNAVITDPVAVFLLGATGIQLYFLPLLLTGLTLLYCIATPIRRLRSIELGVMSILAILLYEGLVISGKVFHLESNPAYQHLFDRTPLGNFGGPVEFVVTVFSYALRCLPLILLAFLLNRSLKPPTGTWNLTVLLLAGGLLLLQPLMPGLSLPLCVRDEVFSMGAFLLAWGLSFVMEKSAFVARLGTYSFGIYLCHQVFLELLQMILAKRHIHIAMQGLPFTFGVTALTFAAAWGAVALADHSIPIVRTAFGLQERRSARTA